MKEKVIKVNLGKDVIVDLKGNVIIIDLEIKVSYEIFWDKLVFVYVKGELEILKIFEFNGGVNVLDLLVYEVLEFVGGVNGELEI